MENVDGCGGVECLWGIFVGLVMQLLVCLIGLQQHQLFQIVHLSFLVNTTLRRSGGSVRQRRTGEYARSNSIFEKVCVIVFSWIGCYSDMVMVIEIFGLVRKWWKLFYFPFYYYLLERI